MLLNCEGKFTGDSLTMRFCILHFDHHKGAQMAQSSIFKSPTSITRTIVALLWRGGVTLKHNS